LVVVVQVQVMDRMEMDQQLLVSLQMAVEKEAGPMEFLLAIQAMAVPVVVARTI
jgi:hypothetical protein